MKDKIHPAYHEKSKIKCACGKTLTVGSTREKLQVEICSNCHPFYTGKENLIDTAGRIEKFQSRRTKAETPPVKTKKNTVKKATSKSKKKEIKL